MVKVGKALWKLYSLYVNSFFVRVFVLCALLKCRIYFSASPLQFCLAPWHFLILCSPSRCAASRLSFWAHTSPCTTSTVVWAVAQSVLTIPRAKWFCSSPLMFSFPVLSQCVFCSGIVTCTKGQQFKREVDRWVSVWKYLSVSFSWDTWLWNFVAFSWKLACWWIYPSGLPKEGEPAAKVYAETSEMWFLEVLLCIIEREQELGWSESFGEHQKAWLSKRKIREGNFMWLKFERQ